MGDFQRQVSEQIVEKGYFGLTKVQPSDLFQNILQYGVRERKPFLVRCGDIYQLHVPLDRVGDMIYMRRISRWPELDPRVKEVWEGSRHIFSDFGRSIDQYLLEQKVKVDEGREKTVRVHDGSMEENGGLMIKSTVDKGIYAPDSSYPWNNNADIREFYNPTSHTVDSIIVRLPEDAQRPYLALCVRYGIVDLKGRPEATPLSDSLSLPAPAASEEGAVVIPDGNGHFASHHSSPPSDAPSPVAAIAAVMDASGPETTAPPRHITNFAELNTWRVVMRSNLVDCLLFALMLPRGGIMPPDADFINQPYLNQSERWKRLVAKTPVVVPPYMLPILRRRYLDDFNSKQRNAQETLLAFQLNRLISSIRHDIDHLLTTGPRDIIDRPLTCNVIDELIMIGVNPLRIMIDAFSPEIQTSITTADEERTFEGHSSSISIKPTSEGCALDTAIEHTYLRDSIVLPLQVLSDPADPSNPAGKKETKGKGKSKEKPKKPKKSPLCTIERKIVISPTPTPLIIEVNRQDVKYDQHGIAYPGEGLNEKTIKMAETLVVGTREYQMISCLYRINDIMFGCVAKMDDGQWYQMDNEGLQRVEAKDVKAAVESCTILYMYCPVSPVAAPDPVLPAPLLTFAPLSTQARDPLLPAAASSHSSHSSSPPLSSSSPPLPFSSPPPPPPHPSSSGYSSSSGKERLPPQSSAPPSRHPPHAGEILQISNPSTRAMASSYHG